MNVSTVYAYVAQENLILSIFQQSLYSVRSTVWDFFGLLDRFLFPNSIVLLRLVGVCLAALNFFLISRLLNALLGQRIWGFFGAFLISISSFMVVGAVTGSPAESSATIIILFLIALYKNQYVYAGLLSGVAVAAHLPGFIFFLIAILDLLQNSKDKQRILQTIIYASGAFFFVLILVLVYSKYSGTARLVTFPLSEPELTWSLIGAAPLLFVNLINFVGVIYLIVARRFDAYRNHFHAVMLWLTCGTLSIVQPLTSNLLAAFIVSSILAIGFIQSFAATWNSRLLPTETIVFFFALIFLSTDIFANDRFLKDQVLGDCRERTRAVEEVVAMVDQDANTLQVVTNFAPSELSVKLGRSVVSFFPESELGKAEPLLLGGLNPIDPNTIYIVDKTSKIDTAIHGCKMLMRGSYQVGGTEHFVEVLRTEGKN